MNVGDSDDKCINYVIMVQSSSTHQPQRGVKGSEKGRHWRSWAHVPEQGALTGLNSSLSDAFEITTSVKSPTSLADLITVLPLLI